jgi:peptidoglycan/xylan/chitin deacetylase (PgdA/CDA1 family)
MLFRALTAGLEELAKRRLPATVSCACFVPGGSFWWDSLAGKNGLSERVREVALNRFCGLDEAIMAWAWRRPCLDPGSVTSEAATQEELARAATTPGITFGSHTWSHANLSRLPESDLEELK